MAGTFPALTGSNANNHQHWLSVYCGHEIQINESLQYPGSDAIKTGSMYGFANINAKQARNNERQTQGVWHRMEIRMVGQQYTVLVDGNVINQFDNWRAPGGVARPHPPTPARQFPRGYFGLQTHGGTTGSTTARSASSSWTPGHPAQRRAALARRLRPRRQGADVRPRRVGQTPNDVHVDVVPQQRDRGRSRALPRSGAGGPRQLQRPADRGSARCRCRTAARSRSAKG